MSDKKTSDNENETNNIPNLTHEEIENLDVNNKEIQRLIKEFETEFPKYAVWRGNPTKAFKNWLKKEKVYIRDKERISLYVSDKTKNRWQEFIMENKQDISTLSELIRKSVKLFIQDSKIINNSFSELSPNAISNLSHALKEPLTSIKGYSQLLLESERYKGKLSEHIEETINQIFAQSNLLETVIKNFIDKMKPDGAPYDILLIEDDLSTIKLITFYFERKGYKCKGVASGTEGLNELYYNNPNLILIDTVLPDCSGYELCKQIKSDMQFRNTRVYLLSIPGTKVDKYLRECRADGYISKSFDFFDDDGGEDRFPFPFIYKPPAPPGDSDTAVQLQVNKFEDNEPENEVYCQYCGRKLMKEERFSHNCRRKFN